MKEENMSETAPIKKFAGLEVPPDLTRTNFFFLYLCALVSGMTLVIPTLIQPAFLQETIKVPDEIFGITNSFMQNISQIATLIFVGVIGVLSDRAGRKILACVGFAMIVVFYFLLGKSVEIAAVLNLPEGLASTVCAYLSFAPTRAADFTAFAPELLVAYGLRFILGLGMILCYPQFITMVADYTYEKDRGKGMAMNGIMMGLSSILVFAIVAPIAKKIGINPVFGLASAVGVVGLLCTWLFLKDRMPEKKKEEKKSLKEILSIVRKSTALKTSYLCTLIGRADIGIMTSFLVIWFVYEGQNMGMTPAEATQKGAVPVIIMGLFTLVAFPVVGVLLDKWGRTQTLITSFLAGGTGVLLIAVSPSPFSWLDLLLYSACLVRDCRGQCRRKYPCHGCIAQGCRRIDPGRSQYHAAHRADFLLLGMRIPF
jgi:MFS family permease